MCRCKKKKGWLTSGSPSPTLEHSTFSLFKRFSSKLWFLFDACPVSRNKHYQDRYSLGLKKPSSKSNHKRQARSAQECRAQLTFFPRQARGPVERFRMEERSILSGCRLIITGTERKECIFLSIFHKTFRFERVRVFPITSYRNQGENWSKLPPPKKT